MRDLLIIPTFNRPEMLTLCVEGLLATPRLSELEIWVCIDDHFDRRYDADVYEAIRPLFPFRPRVIQRTPSNSIGNSLNIMEAYREAFQTKAEFVFLLEDDIVVEPDFFDWHYSVHAGESLAGSVAARPGGDGRDPKKKQEGYFVTDKDFCSLGLCWRRETLGLIVPHANRPYYMRQPDYCREHFPASRFGNEYGEQDGLIRRIVEANRLRIGWPWRPRAWHIGIYGYHLENHAFDKHKAHAPFPQRLSELRQTLSDLKEVRKWRDDCDPVGMTEGV